MKRGELKQNYYGSLCTEMYEILHEQAMSDEMLDKLRHKAPNAKSIQADIINYTVQKKFDYIFILSGSISLFTDMSKCRGILQRLKELLVLEENGYSLLILSLTNVMRTVNTK